MNDKKRKSGNICAVKGCKNKMNDCYLSFFRFPKDVARAQIWALDCGREDLLAHSKNLYKRYRVCNVHFEKNMFLNDLKNRLQPHASPKIFPNQEFVSKDIEHNYSLLCSPNLPECSKSVVKKDAVEIIEIFPPKIQELKQEVSTSTILHTTPKICVEQTLSKDIEHNYSLPSCSSNLSECTKRMDTEDAVKILENLLPKIPRMQKINQEANASTVLSKPKLPDTSKPLTSTSSTQTPKSLLSSTPRTIKMRRRIRQLRKENVSLKHKIEKLERQNNFNEITLEQYKMSTYKFCSSKELADFINVQVSQGQKKPRGRRYTDEFKNYCLPLYFMEPRIYKTSLMESFCLPGPKVLGRFIQDIKPTSDINKLEIDEM